MVVVKDVVLNVTGSTRKIDAELDALSATLRDLDNQDVAIQVKTESVAARKDLDKLRQDLRSIDRSSVSPEVQLRLDRATLEIDKFEKRLVALGKKKLAPEALIGEINNLRGSIQRVGASAVSAGADIERSMRRAEAATKKETKAAEDAAKAAKKAADATREVEVRTAPTRATAEEDQRVLATIAEQAERARQSVITLREYIADIGDDEEFTLNVDDSDARADIAAMRAELESIDLTSVSPEVSVATGKALADLAVLDERLDTIGRKRINIDTKGSVVRELAAVEKGVVGVGTAMTSLSGGALEGIKSGFSSFTQGLKSLTPVVNGLAGLLAAKLSAGLIAVAGGLVGAAAGAAALTAALLAMAGPVVAVVIAAMVRLAKVVEVIKLRDQAKDAAARKSAEGTRAAAVAAEQRRDAEDSLGDAVRAEAAAEQSAAQATRNVATQKVAAYRAMEDAAEAASDAIRGIADADLSLDEANLNYRQAKKDLADYRNEIGATGTAIDQVFKKFTDVSADFSAGAFRAAITAAGGTGSQAGDLELERRVLAVRRARQQEEDATDGVSDARREATRAGQDEAKFLKDGIKAYEPYTAALQAEKDAQDAVAQAHRTVARQRRNLNNVLAQGDLGADDAAKAEAEYDKLTETEQRLVDLGPKVKKALQDAFGPATEGVLGGLISAAEDLPGLLGGVQDALGRLGGAIGTSIGDLTDALGGDRVTGALNYFTDNATAAVPKVTGVFEDLASAIGDIAIQAMPALQEGLDTLAKKVEDFRKFASSGESIPYVTEFTQDFESVMGVLSSAGGLILEFARLASPAFRDLADWIKEMADKATEWLKSAEGQEKVREFFEDTIPAVKEFLEFLGRIIVIFLEVWQFISPILQGITDAFNGILEIVGWLLDKLNDFFSNPALRAVRFAIGQFLAFGTIGRVLRLAGRAVKWLLEQIGKFKGIPGLLSKVGDWLIGPFRAFRDWVLRMLRNLPGRIGDWFNALPEKVQGAIATAVTAFTGFGSALLTGLIDGLTAAPQWVWDKITGLVDGIIDFVKEALGIASPSKVFFDIGVAMIQGLIDGFTTGDAAKKIGAAVLRIAGSLPEMPLKLGKKIVEGGWSLARAATGLAAGGVVTGRTFAELGEGAHHEAVLPLSARVMRRLGSAIASQMRVGGGAGMLNARMPAIATSGSDRGRTVHIDKIVLPPAPGGGIPDARYQAVQLAKEIRRRGGGG